MPIYRYRRGYSRYGSRPYGPVRRARYSSGVIRGRGAYSYSKNIKPFIVKHVQPHTKGLLKYVGRKVGASVGRQMGLRSGADFLGDAGAKVGQYLGEISGLGAYKFTRNSLFPSKPMDDQVPFMHSARDGVRIRHREFIADISSSTSFVNTAYSVNPGLSETFPWLSAISQNFEEYRFEGLVFEFVTTSANALNSTNTALGTVIMAAEYNVAQPNYINKQQMENSMWAVSSKPSKSFCAPIECAPAMNPLANQYIRIGQTPVGQDSRLYDLCNLQVATVGSQAVATIGELWATYDVVLLKPQLSSGLNLAGQSAHYQLVGATSNAPLGSTATDKFDSIGLSISPTGLTFPIGAQGNYLINYSLVGSTASGLVAFTVPNTGCSYVMLYNNDGGDDVANSGFTGNTYMLNFEVNVPDPTSQAHVTFSTGGVLPLGTVTGDLLVTQLNGSLNS